MIGALVEGVTQSLLPCSWILVVPAAAVGLGTRRVGVLATFVGAVVVAAWVAVAGWVVPPLWLAGVVILVGGLLWWRFGVMCGPVAMVAAGAAWAWQPCVGPELGEALTTAQYDPWAAFGGLAMFLIGVLIIGVAIGIAGGAVFERFGKGPFAKLGAVVAMALGFTMVIGIYPKIASSLAQWSTTLWA